MLSGVDFDISDFQADDEYRLPSPQPKRRRAKNPTPKRMGQRFVAGPIPWDWIAQAGRLKGRALHLAIAIWFQAGLVGDRRTRLNGAVLESIGLTDRATLSRALTQLEDAGLIQVERKRGRRPTVELLQLGDDCAQQQPD